MLSEEWFQKYNLLVHIVCKRKTKIYLTKDRLGQSSNYLIGITVRRWTSIFEEALKISDLVSIHTYAAEIASIHAAKNGLV